MADIMLKLKVDPNLEMFSFCCSLCIEWWSHDSLFLTFGNGCIQDG